MMVIYLVHTWDVGTAAGLEEPDPILMRGGSFNGWFIASDSEVFRNLRFRMPRGCLCNIRGTFRSGIPWRLILSLSSSPPHTLQSRSRLNSSVMFI